MRARSGGSDGGLRARRSSGRTLAALIALVCVLLPDLAAGQGPASSDAQERGWAGRWQTYWREGEALLLLEQDGDRVTGHFEPQGGSIEAEVDGPVLRGSWRIDAVEGRLLFALGPKGETFTGRFDSDEYWNGRRVRPGETLSGPFRRADSPREALRTALVAANEAIFAGNAAATRRYAALLDYAGPETDNRDRTRRRKLLWHILDASTFRIYDAPADGEDAAAVFEIGPIDGTVRYPLRFVERPGGVWRIQIETEDRLRAALDAILAELGHGSVEEMQKARRDTPRETMRRFIEGVHDWEGEGRARAFSALDLSFLPPHLREIEGELLADYLKRILDRAGFVIWQEIPNDPLRPMPYVFYQHPAGAVAIEHVEDPSGEAAPRWLFSEDTLRNAPELLTAIQALPLARGVVPVEPLSDFFQLREEVRKIDPSLLMRRGALEIWQWISLALLLPAAALAGWAASAAVRALARRSAPGSARPKAPSDRARPLTHLPSAVSVAVFGVVLTQATGMLGIVHAGLDGAGRAVAVLTVGAIAVVLLRAVGGAARALSDRQRRTPYADEIALSLGSGIIKGAIIVGAVVIAADIVQIPYEGVVAGLGVGGVAFAFASRDTVSNMIGGVLLMTDRPFRRGDLVETDGTMAVIEDVGLRSTRLRRLDDAVLIIPNAQLSDKAIVNWGMRQRRAVILDIGLVYDTPREKLDAFVGGLREVYLAQPRADGEDCYVGLKNFGTSSIDIECRGFFKVYSYEAQVHARDALVGDIVDLARRLGVSFAFPTRTLHLVQEPPASD